MAEILRAKYDWAKPSVLTTTEKQNYPWDEWFDGRTRRIFQGDDFTTHPLMMERIIRTRATGRKVRVRLRHEGQNGDSFGAIVLQRVPTASEIAAVEAAKAERKAARTAEKVTAEKAAAPAAKTTKATAKRTARQAAKPKVKAAENGNGAVSKRPTRKAAASKRPARTSA